MRRRSIRSASLGMAIALCLLPWPALAANKGATVTGCGGSAFPAGSTFNGVALTSYRFGLGIMVASDGTATGDLETTLLGTYQYQPWTGSVVCKAAAGSVNPSGLVTFSGTCYIDMGAASPPSSAAFTSTGRDKQNTLSLTVGSTTWQIATGTNGSITVILN